MASFVGGELGKAWECFWFEEKQEQVVRSAVGK